MLDASGDAKETRWVCYAENGLGEFADPQATAALASGRTSGARPDRARGCAVSPPPRRKKLSAVAVKTWPRRIRAWPIYRVRRRAQVRTPRARRRPRRRPPSPGAAGGERCRRPCRRTDGDRPTRVLRCRPAAPHEVGAVAAMDREDVIVITSFGRCVDRRCPAAARGAAGQVARRLSPSLGHCWAGKPSPARARQRWPPRTGPSNATRYPSRLLTRS